MTIYHKHHIIPRHMGGTDDPSNLIKVTIEEHALLHKQLWEELGKKEDFIAWQCLSGQITMSEAKREAQKIGSSRGGKIGGPIAGQKCKKEKIGFLKRTKEENIAAGKKLVEMKKGIHSDNWDKAIGGKIGGIKCKDQKIGFFSDGEASRGGQKSYLMGVGIHKYTKEQRMEIGKMGGQKCKEQGIGFLDPNFDVGKASRGKIWINKDGVEMKIFPQEFYEMKMIGWERGRKQSFRRKQ